jgi:hypothetical protein
MRSVNYDAWGELIRGALVWLGQADPVAGVDDFFSVADGQDAHAIAALAELHRAGCTGLTEKEGWAPSRMLAEAMKNPALGTSLAELVDPDSDGTELPSKKALANALHRHRESFKGSYRLRGKKNTHTEAVVWWVEQVAEATKGES